MTLSDSQTLKKKEVVTKCEEIVKQNPNNLSCKYAIEYLQSDEVKEMTDEGK
jgi:hypothetical protein